MPDLEHTIPAASGPLPADESYLTTVRRWLEGYVDESTGKPVPGLIVMVTELYEEAKLRRERREAFWRAVASGGVLAVVAVIFGWLKDHLK